METMNNEKKAKRYHDLKITLFLLDTTILFAFLFFFVRWRGAHLVRDRVIQYVSLASLQILVYAGILATFAYLLEFPVRFAGGYLLEKRFGLSTLSFQNWCGREGKKIVLSLLFFLLLVETGYFFVWTFEGRWWIGFGVLWFFYQWVLMQLFPVWIVPLFYRYSPIQDERLVAMLKAFASRYRRDITSVRMIHLSEETKKVNAAVLGFGRKKRIVLADTLLRRFGLEEIKVIFAHELGHDQEHHLFLSFLLNAFVIFGGIYATQRLLLKVLPSFEIGGLSDLAALPLFCFLFAIFGFLVMPFQNGFSRFLEKRADLFALRATGLKEAFISSMQKLAEQNLSDMHPSRWVEILFHTHPSISRRIEFAKRF